MNLSPSVQLEWRRILRLADPASAAQPAGPPQPQVRFHKVGLCGVFRSARAEFDLILHYACR
jgi:hypothetical protein